MSKKIMGILIILVGLLLLAGIVYVVFFNNFSLGDLFGFLNKEEAEQTEIQQTNESSAENQDQEEVVVNKEIKRISAEENQLQPQEEKKPKVSSTQIDKDDLMRMAASFSERFGSYSNQSNFSNIVDLKIFMSQRMQLWADSYIADQRKQDVARDIYYGITTKAVSQEIKDLDYNVGKASVLVQTRRRESINSTNNTTKSFSQSIIINFVKERGAWKVDNAVWQEE